MKLNYRYYNGKINVSDDKKGVLKYEYARNIHGILVKENVIEQIENDIKSLTLEKQKIERELLLKNSNKNKILRFSIPLVTIGLLLSFVSVNLSSILVYKILLILGSFSIGTLFGLGFNVLQKAELKPLEDKLNGVTLTIEKLTELLEVEKQNLQDLKINDYKFPELKSKDKKYLQIIDDVNELKNIKNLIQIYNICGKYMNLLTKYYEKGTLHKKLLDKFSEDDIKIIEEVIQNKGSQLIKKYKY